MGFKDWMLFYADEDVAAALRSQPRIDREATRALVTRLYPEHDIAEIEDGSLFEQANPPRGEVYAACMPGVSVVCTRDAADDTPADIDPRFVAEARGRTLYLHAMHSVVDWFAYAIWEKDGTLRRALSLSPDGGIMQDIGARLPFEDEYWAGDAEFLEMLAADGEDYPFRFHPLDLAEAALRTLFGFSYEGPEQEDDPDLEEIVLAGFAVTPRA